MMQYNTHTLANGLRVIHLPLASPVVYCGYAVNAGARNEGPGEQGLAHFCEHMTFKGTSRLSSLQVINTLERVGGELNAFTTKEDTFYYAAVLREHFNRAVDLLTDIVFNSQYPQHEIDKEVEVVCDEIESYNDTPADLIYDEFENVIFADSSLGHNILGEADHVREFKTEDCLRFTRKHYTPGNCVFYVYGNVDFARLTARLERLLEQSSSETCASTAVNGVEAGPCTPVSKTPAKAGEFVEVEINSHQAHLMVGTAIPLTPENSPSTGEKYRLPLFLLNNILGGPSMNSRFNIALREKRGLVYSVDSTMTSYSDTLLWTVYLGCDEHDVRRCRRLLRSEIDRIIAKPLSPTALRNAKQQIKGQLSLASENRENFAIDFAKQYLHRGTLKNNERLFARIDAITAEQLQETAATFLTSERLITLIMK